MPGVRVTISQLPGSAVGPLLPGRLKVPAILDELTLSREAAWSEYDTVSAGEFAVPVGGRGTGRRKLERFPMQIMAAEAAHRFIDDDAMDVVTTEFVLDTLLDTKRPVGIRAQLMGRTVLDVEATLRSRSVALRGGQPGERYFDTQWVEHRDVTLERRKVTYLMLPTNHRIVEGDTLGKVSRRYYGTAANWKILKTVNRLRNIGVDDFLRGRNYFPNGGTLFVPRVINGKAADEGRAVRFGRS